MYKKLAKQITQIILKNNKGHKEYQEIYEYGFECLIAIIINIITVLVVGSLLHMTLEVLIYMSCYTMLRINTGGFHFKTHLVCIGIYSSLAIASICTFRYLGEFQMCRYIYLFAILMSIILIIRYCPVSSANKELDAELRVKLRKNGIITVILLSCFMCVLLFLDKLYIIQYSGIAAMFVQSFTLLPVFNQNSFCCGQAG